MGLVYVFFSFRLAVVAIWGAVVIVRDFALMIVTRLMFGTVLNASYLRRAKILLEMV